MKKTTSLLLIMLSSIFATAQSVAINTDNSAPNSSAMLDIKSTTKGLLIPRLTQTQRNAVTTPATGLLIYQTDNTPGYYYFNGSAWTALTGPGGTNYWAASGTGIHNSNSGNVGVGTTTPANTFQIGSVGTSGFAGNQFVIGSNDNALSINQGGSFTQLASSTNIALVSKSGAGNIGINVTDPQNTFQIGAVNYGGYLLAAGDGSNSFAFLQTDNSTSLSSTTNINLYPANGFGRVGINTSNLYNTLQIGSVGSTGFAGNAFAIGNGTAAMTLNQDNSVVQLASTTNISLAPQKGSGNLGINVLLPANILQIGSVGNSGYAGNAFAIGNGTNALGLNQGNSFAQLSSSTDIVLAPKNGNGRVGINTSTPKAPLDVEGLTSILAPNGIAYYGENFVNSNITADFGGTDAAANISIYASNNMMASQFDAFSDERIKDIIGVSDKSEDLQTINALRVTNYTLKDKIKNGNKEYKKVIAQQVEKVYPQVVSKHRDFVPNVYQLTNKIEKIADDYLLTFAGKHHISNAAKKLQVIMQDNSIQDFEIVSVPSSSQVIIDATDLKADKLFVYGEEVDDFRTVDYEGLTTLNISATQEIYRQLQKEKYNNKKLEKRVVMLEEAVLLQRNHSSVKNKKD